MLGKRIGAAVGAAVMLGAAARAPAYWAQTPSKAQWAAVRPAAARTPGVVGRAAISCKAQADGALADCKLTLDSPAGQGFGAALLALAPDYRVNMAAKGAPAVGGEVHAYGGWATYDTPPNWLRRPTSSELMSVWPAKAWARAQGGEGTINCLVSVQGALYDCVPISETPPGEHFGDAALALAPQLLMKPATFRGQPVISAVSVPIAFAEPPGATAPRSNFGAKAVVSPAMAWAQAPGYAAVAAAYPAKARAAKVGGRATLNCEFTREGRLARCDTIAEEPRREGFADAARTLAAEFQGPTKLSDGRPITGARVELPVVFDPAMLAGGPAIIGKAQWAGLPSAEDTVAAFGKLTVAGTVRVRLACLVLQGGAVSDCRVEQEDPAGQGVGQAALSLAPAFRLTTWTAEGLPTVGGTITIPLRYEPTTPAPAPKG